MNDPLEALIVDLLEWIGPDARPYADVIEAWRTSCPKLPVWEEANLRGFIEHRHGVGREASVALTAVGRRRLELARELSETCACTSATILPSGSSTPISSRPPCT